MEWQQLIYFKEVAEREHYLHAARALSISQPALSRSIGKLEEQLGVPLFEKRGRGIVRSVYGDAFYVHAVKILEEMEQAEKQIQKMKDPHYGEITLGFMRSQGLQHIPHVMKNFKESYPSVQFSLNQGSTEELINQLKEGKLDLCICNMNQGEEGLAWQQLWSDQLYVYVSDAHPLAWKQQLTLEEIEKEPFLLISPGFSARVMFEQIVEKYGLKPNVAFESEDIMTILGFVAAGQGVALLPAFENLQVQHVRSIPLREPTQRNIGIAIRDGSVRSSACDQFINHLLAYSKQLQR
ncbi:LysR family transcriptional regulator [Terribacillus sp. DMT04]|uniref:LysR family transcriptional regulator n=1 Tax=Terribacillus sp. DMT04 TaxID=2850441 RepID=UPI001C2C81E2|nr:LysR substrate-binding domain-containing protein [Terribacillus sp. DMT04]QXE02611.1 LysR family transcriptional regulator [Terribacillus sp. DMT04]